MSSSHSPCAACKLQRRKCTQECIFSPYFPPDQPQKFSNVHRVFGASNVAKLLNELSVANREDAVTSLAYEAEARLRDPVYGCVSVISALQQRLRQIEIQLMNARKELAAYIGPTAMLPVAQHGVYMPPPPQQQYMSDTSTSVNPYNSMPPPPMLGLHPGGGGSGGGPSHGGQLTISESQPQQAHQQQQNQNQHQQQQLQQHLQHQQQQILESQQLAAAMVARGRQHQQEQGLLLFDNGFDPDGNGMVGPGSSFNQMTAASAMSPSLTLGSFEDHHRHQLQLQLQPQLFSHPQNEPQFSQQQQQAFGTEEGRNVGPSC